MKSLVFRTLPVRDLRKILSPSSTQTYLTNEIIVEQGKTSETLYLLIKGGYVVQKQEKRIAYLLPGQFIGEMSFINHKPASATVITEENSELVCWKRENLQKLLDKNPSLNKYFLSLIGADLTRKLTGS